MTAVSSVECAESPKLSPGQLPQYPGDLNAGQIIDSFRIESVLGRGGMSTVYLVQHLTLRKPQAMKVLHFRNHSEHAGLLRFEQEAQQAGKLNHPNILSISDFGATPDGQAFLVMEYAPAIRSHTK